jgi:type 1 fimbria pilin
MSRLSVALSGVICLLGVVGGARAADAPVPAAAAGTEMHFGGALVSTPCTLSAQDANLQLPLTTVSKRFFIRNTRTATQHFQLHLEHCDLARAAQVHITFKGQDDGAHQLKDDLAVVPTGTNGVQGIALGLEDGQGNPLPLNVSSTGQKLTSGDNVIPLGVYIAAEPAAVKDPTRITPGGFSAQANFVLEYQ